MKRFILICTLFASLFGQSQNIGINTTGAAPDASAILDIDSDGFAKAGLLIPRMSTAQRNSIPVPALSLLIFNTTLLRFEYFSGAGGWKAITGDLTLDDLYDAGGAGLGRTIVADAGAVQITGTDGLVSTGTTSLGAAAPSGSGTRMVWNPKKAALRAGQVIGNAWDDANVGLHSTAFGLNTTASGQLSFSAGSSSVASGSTSVAMGNGNTSSGAFSTSFGSTNTSSGTSSFSTGQGNEAPSFAEAVLGSFNTTYVPASTNSLNTLDRAFTVGIGSSTTVRKDGLVLLKNGNLGIGISTPGANLHVNSSTSSFSRFQLTNAVSGASSSDGLAITSISSFASIVNMETGSLVFGTSGLTRAVIGADGNFGIGIFSPVSDFHINNSSTVATARMTNSSSGHTANDGIEMTLNGTQATLINREISSFIIGTNNLTNQLVLSNTGRVGIGKTSPTSQLHMAKATQGEVAISIEEALPSGVIFSTTNTGTTGINVDVSSVPSWFGASSAATSFDGILWTGGLATANQVSDILDITFQFPAGALPAGAIVQGVSVTIVKRASDSNDIFDSQISLKSGGSVGVNKAALSSPWFTSMSSSTYGGSTDLWGLSITEATVNSGQLGMRIRYSRDFDLSSNAEQGFIDRVQATVFYTDPVNLTSSIWTAGSLGGEYRVNNQNNLSTAPEIAIGTDGVTSLKGLRISNGAANGNVLTSDGTGTATWQPNPGMQDLALNVNELSLSNSAAVIDLSPYAGWSLTGNSISSSSTQFIGTINSLALAFRTGNLQRMTISALGDVGIGTSLPNEKLHIQSIGTTFAKISSSSPLGGEVGIDFDVSGPSPVDWRMSNGGSFLKLESSSDNLATLTGRYQFNTASFLPLLNGSQTLGGSLNRWNTVFATNGVISTSDEREKSNIDNLNYGLAEVMMLRPVRFTWNTRPEEGEKLGLIAQELQKVLPETVRDWDWQEDELGNRTKVQADRLGVYYSDLIPVLIKAIQDQQKSILEIQQKIILLEQH